MFPSCPPVSNHTFPSTFSPRLTKTHLQREGEVGDRGEREGGCVEGGKGKKKRVSVDKRKKTKTRLSHLVRG